MHARVRDATQEQLRAPLLPGQRPSSPAPRSTSWRMDLEHALTLLHLCAWAQVGTVVRIYIGKLFGGACDAPDYTGRW